MFDHTVSGTTVSMHKKGSGLSEILNPCLDRFMQTSAYMDICKKYDLESACDELINKGAAESIDPWKHPTNELPQYGYSCSDGYCSCDA